MAFGNAAAERAALEMTYEDSMTVTRRITERGNSAISRVDTIVIYESVRCALSYERNSSEQTDTLHKIDSEAVIFCAPEYETLPGDCITVQRFGKSVMYEAIGRARVYETHREIDVRECDIA